MEKLNKDEQEIIDLAKDDYIGLYEITWRKDDVDLSIGENYSRADKAIRSLLQQNKISLYKHTGFLKPNPELVNPGEVDEVLKNPVSWYPEHDGVSYSICINKNSS